MLSFIGILNFAKNRFVNKKPSYFGSLKIHRGWSEISGNIRRKWNDTFRLNRANQKEWLLHFFIRFPNSLIRTKNLFVKNGTANFGRNIPTEISGQPPEVIPNIPVGRNRKGPFHLDSDRNFRNLWHNGKQPSPE